MSKNVSFYDTNINADYSNASYIINKPLSVPDFVTQETDKETDKLLKEIRKGAIKVKKDEDPFGVIDDDVEDDVEQLISDNDTRNELFEELLHTIFAGEEINDKEFIDKYIELLLSMSEY